MSLYRLGSALWDAAVLAKLARLLWYVLTAVFVGIILTPEPLAPFYLGVGMLIPLLLVVLGFLPGLRLL